MAVHGHVQKTKLADANEHAVESQIAKADSRPRQKEDGGNNRQREAQGRKQQRREMSQGDLDDDEIGSPDNHDGHGQQKMTEGERGRHE